jgi:glycogen debranching enzyme
MITAQSDSKESVDSLATTLSADSGNSMRFVAAHGRRSVIMGYSAQGLEVWGYPFQILSGYQIGFKPVGSATETDGRSLMRRVDYSADSITRVYIGPDFIVREKLFVPLDEPGVAISFEVEGATQLDIAIHFQPVMDLMWPAALGGQYTRWNAAIPGYVITEPEHGFSASIGSPDTIFHDDTVNSTVRRQTSLSFVVRTHPASGRTQSASVYVVLNEANTKDPAAPLHELSAHVREREEQAAKHYADLASRALRIETPDAEVNQAISWSEIALDQAWVCNPLLGCGIVAGYGPSRDARRPQYDWFFAGDGLITTNALISAGEYGRAKEELEFIAKYQQPKTGMIWHELSQSAGYIDWAKYPYMYVHVDITADYLAAVARYVVVSGDVDFAREHWPSIALAYQYCRSLINSVDHLPHIPPDKEGGDEQARPEDDLSLSAGVLDAYSGFAELARLVGQPEMQSEAAAERALLGQAIATHYWDQTGNFWINGHTQGGTPIASRRLGPTQLISKGVFSHDQNESLLNQLSSSDFRTDWGMRGLAISSADFDPYSYGRGSVSAPATTGTATTFWTEHRPEIASSIWRGVLEWNRLDSLGHLHEVLAGNFFHEQTESVPEQTWSSAGLLSSTVLGLLGLHINGLENRIDFMPHLPADWNRVAIENVRLPQSTMSFALVQSMTGVDLAIDNKGSPAQIIFEPQIPLGARLMHADYQGQNISAKIEMFSEDEHAILSLQVPPGKSHCHLQIEGGLSFLENRVKLKVGDPNTDMKITSLHLQGHTLSLEADVHPNGRNSFLLRTPWKLVDSKGASSTLLPNGDFEFKIASPLPQRNDSGYSHSHVTLSFVGH